MTLTHASVTSSPQHTAAPEIVRVCVLHRHTQMDVGLPVALSISAATAELASIATRRDPDPSDADPRLRSWNDRWQLLRVGGEPLSPGQSVAEAGVRDGDLLILSRSPVAATPVLFDDVVDAMAQVSASRFREWTPQAAAAVGFAVCAVAIGLTLAVSALSHHRSGSPLTGAICGVGALAALIATWRLRRHAEAVPLCRVLSGCATALACAAAIAATPGPFGAPHLAFGAVVAALLAVVTARWGNAAPQQTSAILTAASMALATTLLAVAWQPNHAIATAAAVGLLVISWAPRIATGLAKVPVPPVPTSGEPIDPVDNDPQPAVEGIGAIGAVSIPSAAALDQRAVRANQLLTGIICAAGLFTALASATTAIRYSPAGASPAILPTAFSFVIAAALALRARSYGHVIHAGWLMLCGTSSALAVIVGMVLRECVTLEFAVAAMILGAAAALIFGSAIPRGDYSPPMRRAVEITEYLLLAAVVPLLCAVVQIYLAVRDIW